MLQSNLVVDLPSAEIRRAPRPSEWVRSLFGADPALPGSGREELTISAVALIASLHRAFRTAGVADAVSLAIDGKVVWSDPHDRPDDLERMWAQVRERGVLDRPFDQMSLLLARRWQGMFLLFDLRLSRTVVLGEAEMLVEVYGRPEISPQVGDTARGAWDRAYRWFSDPDALDRGRIVLAAQVHALRDALAGAISDCVIRVGPTRVVLVRPSAEEIQALAGTRWPWVSPGRWQITEGPAHPQAPDPFAAFWADPGFPLTRAAAMRAMLEQPDAGARRAGVVVVDTSGRVLFEATSAEDHTDEPWAGRWLQVTDAGLRIGGAPDEDEFDNLPEEALVPLTDPPDDPDSAPTTAPAGRRGDSNPTAAPTWSPPGGAEPAPVERTDDPSTQESTYEPPTVESTDGDPFDDWGDLVEVRSDAKHSVKSDPSTKVADDFDGE